MAKYRKKPVTITANRWFGHGDHPAVVPWTHPTLGPVEKGACGYCPSPMGAHGWVPTFDGGHIVCPGDWIITGVKGEHYPCKHDIFIKTYEFVEDGQVGC